MWWREEQVLELAAPKPEQKLVKAALNSGLTQEERKSYIQSSLKIGLGSTPLLKIILEEGGFEIYPFEQVCDYLDKILGHQSSMAWSQKWGWRGLREIDEPERRNFSYETPDRFCRLKGPYQQEIPYPVLQTVQQILKIAEEINPRFFVSDIMRDADLRRTSLDDPFLAVGTQADREIFVIERWDEPGFSLKAK